MIRLANILEIDEVLEVINDAKALFKSEGSDNGKIETIIQIMKQ